MEREKPDTFRLFLEISPQLFHESCSRQLSCYIAIMQYMKATLIAKSKEIHDDGSIIEVVIWELSEPIPPCEHPYKYRLYFGSGGVCRIRYDNERGKGDHKHINADEMTYRFTTIDQLLDDFEDDITNWRES